MVMFPFFNTAFLRERRRAEAHRKAPTLDIVFEILFFLFHVRYSPNALDQEPLKRSERIEIVSN
jgi:hypothetical protein